MNKFALWAIGFKIASLCSQRQGIAARDDTLDCPANAPQALIHKQSKSILAYTLKKPLLF
jgi:hypothetical protein